MGTGLLQTDRKILAELMINSRQPLSRLAAKARVSKQNAASRISRMAGTGGINAFIALIDAKKIGYITYCLNFRLKPISKNKEKAIIGDILKAGVVSLFRCEGEWNLIVGVVSENIDELAKKSMQIHYILRGLVLATQWAAQLDATTLLPPGIAQSADGFKSMATIGRSKGLERIDGKDRILLSAISTNARASYARLSKMAGFPPETVRYRLRALEKRKIICGYTVSLGTELEGFHHYRIFIDLNVPTEENVRRVFSFLANLKQSRRIVRLMSEFELMYDIRVSGEKEAGEIMESVNRRFYKIISTQVSLRILKEYRFAYFPPMP